MKQEERDKIVQIENEKIERAKARGDTSLVRQHTTYRDDVLAGVQYRADGYKDAQHKIDYNEGEKAKLHAGKSLNYLSQGNYPLALFHKSQSDHHSENRSQRSQERPSSQEQQAAFDKAFAEGYPSFSKSFNPVFKR